MGWQECMEAVHDMYVHLHLAMCSSSLRFHLAAVEWHPVDGASPSLPPEAVTHLEGIEVQVLQVCMCVCT